MKPRVIISVLAVIAACGVIVALRYPKTHARVRHTNNNQGQAPQNTFMAEHGPMMPPPHQFMPPYGPHPMAGEPFGGKIQLTDNQRAKIKDLDRNLNRDMKKLHDEEDELREQYREKIDAVLTDEQFRKIEKMRNDLRKDMKKLREKQHDVIERHKRDFDSILTPEQKKTLERKHNENHKTQGTKDAGTSSKRDDAGSKKRESIQDAK